MAQLVRVQNFNVSRDGFGAGENQSFERPFGHADPGDMFAWAGATASWPNRTDPGGSRGLDDYFTPSTDTVLSCENGDLFGWYGISRSTSGL